MPDNGIVMSADDIRRAIVRVAHEIVEQNGGCRDLMLVGMRTRGVPLAQRLSDAIREFEGESVGVGALDIGLYRDDLPARGTRVEIKPSELPQDIADKRVVLVDDSIVRGTNGKKVVAMLRLSPAVPFNLQNYLYGLTAIRLWPTVITSWFAMLPGTLMYVYFGYISREGLSAAAGLNSAQRVGPLGAHRCRVRRHRRPRRLHHANCAA